MLEGLHESLLRLELDNFTLAHVIQRLAEIEYRLAKGCSDDKQLASLVAAFIFMRESQVKRDCGELIGKRDLPNVLRWVTSHDNSHPR